MTQHRPYSPALAQVLCIVVSLTPALLAVMTFALHATGAFPQGEPLAPALYGPLAMIFAAVAILVARLFRKALLSRMAGGVYDRMRAIMAAMSVADLGAVGAVVLYIFSGSLIVALMIHVVALIGTMSLIPTRAWLGAMREASPPAGES